MRKRAARVCAITFVCVLVGCDHSPTLSIATGNPSGLYYPLGGGLASIWSKHLDDINIKAEVTAGSVTNLIQVAKAESDVGFTQGDAATDAVLGRGRFKKPLPISLLAKLYPNVVHLVTVRGSGIESVSDIRGRRVSVGPPGSGNAVTAWNILAALGIERDEFIVRQLNYTETTNGLKDGTIDAGFIAAGLGVAAVVELSVARNVRLIPFSDDEIAAITSRIPAYSPFSVPPGIYRGVDSPIQTPSLWNLLVVHDDMDPDLAYRLLECFFAYRQELEKISRVAQFFAPETAAAVGSMPLHPGAQRYYGNALGRSRRADYR